jgi:POT family proton-dependent oligopeptide transporter
MDGHMSIPKENVKLKFSKSFYALFFTELWERFSYYGINAILLFYIYYSVSNGGLGISKGLAISILSIYGSFAFLSGILGGYIGDRVLGAYKTVLYGGILIMFGHITLTILSKIEGLFLGLFLIIIGTGFLKPNISKLVGKLYDGNTNMHDSAFSMLQLGVSLGAFISPLVTGWVGLKYNFHYGFLLAAIGMFIGLISFYFVNKKQFTSESNSIDKIQKKELKPMLIKIGLLIIALFLIFFLMNLLNIFNMGYLISLISLFIMIIPIYIFYSILSSKKITTKERYGVLYYIPIFIIMLIASSLLYNLAILVFSTHYVQLDWIPVAWVQSFESGFTILLIPIFVYLYMKLGNRQASTPKKCFYGLIFFGLSFLIMIIPSFSIQTGVKVSILWVILSKLLLAIAMVLLSPISLSATYKLAPKSYKSTFIALWTLSAAVGLAINSQITPFFIGNELIYFMIIGIIPIISAIIFYFYIGKIELALNY